MVAAELCRAGLTETAKRYVEWCREAEARTAAAKAVVATCGVPGVGAAQPDAEVARLLTRNAEWHTEIVRLQAEVAERRSRASLAEAENAVLHSEVTRLGVELRQARPVLPTSANPEHVRRMAQVLWMACGSGQDWTLMARAVLDALPELVK